MGESPCRLVRHDYALLLTPGRLHLSSASCMFCPGSDVREKLTTKHGFATAYLLGARVPTCCPTCHVVCEMSCRLADMPCCLTCHVVLGHVMSSCSHVTCHNMHVTCHQTTCDMTCAQTTWHVTWHVPKRHIACMLSQNGIFRE